VVGVPSSNLHISGELCLYGAAELGPIVLKKGLHRHFCFGRHAGRPNVVGFAKLEKVSRLLRRIDHVAQYAAVSVDLLELDFLLKNLSPTHPE
jgi:hypothetical protein